MCSSASAVELGKGRSSVGALEPLAGKLDLRSPKCSRNVLLSPISNGILASIK
jgi:hypothetical protein